MVIKTETISSSITGPAPREPARTPRPAGPDGAVQRTLARGAGGRAAKPAGIDRALGDALSIAQLSQQVIQRALAVSMRLKSIAAGAAATGRINDGALAEAMSEIRGALEEYGERMPAPARTAPPAPEHAVELPDLRAPMNALRDIAASLGRGNHLVERALNEVGVELSENVPVFKKAEESLVARMGAGRSALITDGTSANDIASTTARLMASQPETAVRAQGNISIAAAERLAR